MADISKALEIEYTALKAEQRQRISTRDNIFYLQLAMLTGLASIFSNFFEVSFLMVAPFVSVVLGWKYISNDIKITQIGLYFKDKAEKLNVFGFETVIRSTPGRKSRKKFEFLVKLITFIVPIIYSAVAIFLTFYENIWLVFLGIFYVACAVSLFYFFLKSNDLS